MHRYIQKSTYNADDRQSVFNREELNEGRPSRLSNWISGCGQGCRDCFGYVWEMCCFCFTDENRTTRTSSIKKEDITYILQHAEGESEPQSEAERHGSFTSGSISSFSSGARDLKSDMYNQIEARRASGANKDNSTAPIIDMKSIDFWSGSSTRDSLQLVQPTKLLGPNSSGRRDTNFSISSQSSADQIRPDLYSNENLEREGVIPDNPEQNSLGSINFFLYYDVVTKGLQVKVIEANDLPKPILLDQSKQDQASSNPYVKILLLPKKDSRQTTIRKKTQNPQFDEAFTFEVTSMMELQKMQLQLVVKDFDKYSRHREIGQATVQCSEVNVVKGVRLSKPLLPMITVSHDDLGEILFSLCYLPSAGRLNVDVLRAKQLLPGVSAPFVKVSLLIGDRHLKTKKTSQKKFTVEPIFNESLSFDVNILQLQEASLVITLMDFNGSIVKDKDNFIGRIVLGKEASGAEEVNHWKTVQSQQRTAVAQWHTLKSKNHCSEVCQVASRILN